MTNTDCPFCNILKENRILEEGKYAFAIFSNPRLMPGHLLVIPKRHIERISELNREEQNEIFDLLVKFQSKIISKLSTGCDIRQNFKPYVENSRTHVDHVHFHLLPRNNQDELYEIVDKNKSSLYKDLTDDEKNKITNLLLN